MSRDLRERRVVALLIDGVHFGPHLVLAAVGVDEHGDKHVLGLRRGGTEKHHGQCGPCWPIWSSAGSIIPAPC